VGPDRERHFAPGQRDVGMVAFRFGHFPHPVGELQGLPEVIEGVLLLEMVVIYPPPATRELVQQRLQLAASQGREATTTGHTPFFRQLTAHAKPLPSASTIGES